MYFSNFFVENEESINNKPPYLKYASLKLPRDNIGFSHMEPQTDFTLGH